MAVITFLSDFGTQDGYAAAMKGVALRHHPQAHLVDVTHDVPPQDVLAGAFALAQAAPWFPPGSYHVAVVDPGVGTGRRALVVEHDGQTYVAPDNGLVSLAAPGARLAWSIERLPADWTVSPTFHGRDLFARVAGWLAAGHTVEELEGRRVEPLALPMPPVQSDRGDLFRGQVIHVDRFGNLITNLSSRLVERLGYVVDVGAVRARGGRTYGDVAPGELLAYAGSAGFLEIGVRDGSAADSLGAARGQPVRLTTHATGALPTT